MQKNGLAALIWSDSCVLILGSLPGDESLALQQYYADRRNQFWRILTGVYNEQLPNDYDSKVNFLRLKALALWDVTARADRMGSTDAKLQDAAPDDFPALLTAHRGLRLIVFNGKRAQELFERLVQPEITRLLYGLRIQRLPSSSSVWARETLEEKIAKWRLIATA